MYCIYIVEPPFGLRRLLPFWCRRGGVLVHGWCAEKENKGKGGSGQGKIGAGVGSCRSMDPGTNFCIFGHRFWPGGIQSGSSWAPLSGGSQIHKKQHFCSVFARFFVILDILAASRQVQTWCQKLENWCPTGSSLDPDWPKAVPKNSKLVPDWVPTGSRLGFFKKTPIPLNLSTYFWNFSTLPCTTRPFRTLQS